MVLVWTVALAKAVKCVMKCVMCWPGLELLLDEVYDTAFSDTGAGRSFTQSNMYRILQRRFLAVQLAMTGRFRCEFMWTLSEFSIICGVCVMSVGEQCLFKCTISIGCFWKQVK